LMDSFLRRNDRDHKNDRDGRNDKNPGLISKKIFM